MQYELYSSIDEMTDPNTLNGLVRQQPFKETCIIPFETNGWSSTDAEFLGVTGCNGDQPRYIIKRLRQAKDWVMAMTDDVHWRAISVWQQGLLNELPVEVDHGIIACSVDEDGYAILMRNVSRELLPEDSPLPESDHALILDALAALHAAFWQDNRLGNRHLNLCRPEDFFSHTSPEKAKPLAQSFPPFVLELITEGRRLLPRFVDGDLAELMHKLVEDPSPLCAALSHYPQTLVHTDVRLANLGIERGRRPRLIVLDWARQTWTVPAVDLIYYLLSSTSVHSHMSLEQSIEFYKRQLARRLGDRFDVSWWQPQLELSLLGTFATMACFRAWGAENSEDESRRMQDRAELQRWAELARPGARRLAQ